MGLHFNEAPAFWPGKGPGRRRCSAPGRTYFNEAPAFWPGKAVLLGVSESPAPLQ